MEAGGKDCEEETLQTAFKKLRVDAESLPGAASVSEALTPRTASRVCLDGSGAKSKLGCPKDNWHCCMRKTSRGASRSQRRRRSKSPILHPPKFTYCSSTTTSALSPPAGCLKHRHLTVPVAPEPRPAADEITGSSVAPPAQTELCSSSTSGNISPLLFGSRAGYDAQARGVVSSPSLPEITTATSSRWEGGNSEDVRSCEGGGPVKSACEGAESGAAEAADFRALSELHSRVSCSCSHRAASDSQEESVQEPGPPCSCRSHRQGWNGMEVYSFTGLRSVISECERSLPSHENTSRTHSSNAAATSSPSSSSPALSSGSPRSCSEQARAYVDDITIEDLSGYMEYYLYIPKKMSHMAEMMYT